MKDSLVYLSLLPSDNTSKTQKELKALYDSRLYSEYNGSSKTQKELKDHKYPLKPLAPTITKTQKELKVIVLRVFLIESISFLKLKKN